MTYKGYTGIAEVDADAGIIHGRVVGLRDVVTFEGETPDKAVEAFRESVDDYLDFCAELGQNPERPISGQFNLRLGVELHRAMAIKAERAGISLTDAVRQAVAKDLGMPATVGPVARAPKPQGPRPHGGKSNAKAPGRRGAPAAAAQRNATSEEGGHEVAHKNHYQSQHARPCASDRAGR